MRYCLLLTAILAGCSDEGTAGEDLPYAEAERIRALTFIEDHASKRRPRDEFLTTSARTTVRRSSSG